MASRNSVGADECALCLCVYKDPRVLPVCGHSFCLECIKKSAKSNRLEVECPLCRKLSPITSGGFEGLPINYALLSLLPNLSSESTKDLGADVDNVLCLHHKDEELVIVCIDCWMSLCVKCHEEAHSKHRMSSVRKFVADAVTKFQSDGKDIDIKFSQMESLKDKLKGNKAEFLNQVIEQEVAVNEEYASLKLFLEQERSKLVEELMMIKQSVLKNIEQHNQELEFQCQELRSLNTRIHEMTKVTGAEVSMAAVAQLKEIKERLNNTTNIKMELKGSKPVVKFLPTNFQGLIKKSSADKNLNMIGKLHQNHISSFLSYNGSSEKTNATNAKAENDTDDDNICIICMDTITDTKTLPCKHKFCRECIDNCFERHQSKCPSCGKVFGILKGNQPPGTMNVRENRHLHLSGYGNCGSFEIEYSFPSGTQRDNHPNPGQYFHGTNRTAYLPANKEGQEVLGLLKRAFDAGLVFTIGRSNTTGQENVVIWNDVHHKTSFHGQYGYPDPTYLKRVKEELAVKGIQ